MAVAVDNPSQRQARAGQFRCVQFASERTQVKFTRNIFLAVALAMVLAASSAFAAASPDAHALANPFMLDPSTATWGIAIGGSIEQIRRLAAQRKTVVEAMNAITAAAAKREDGNLTDEEREKIDAYTGQVTQIDADIKRLQTAMEAARGIELPDGARISTSDNQRDAGNHGFERGFGEFAWAALQAGLGNARDPRLVLGAGGMPQIGAASTAPGSYGNESSGADGGFLVPPDFSTSIVQTAYNQNDSFLPMTDNVPVGGNGMAFPVDETTPWSTAGIKAYWTDEGGAGTETKAQFDPAQLRLKKLTALVPITEEMMADSPALGAYIQGKVPEAISFKTNEALWEGSGAGKPKGFFNATGLRVTVSAEGGQASGTIVAANVSKMRARMAARSFRRAIWQINNDCLPQLDALAYTTTATNTPIYKPEGGKFGYGTLLGKDVMVTDFNPTVGSVGDIALVDWGMYRTITKAGGGMETAASIHFWFDRDITAFRTTFRIDGQPSITKPVTPNKGSNTLSPLVVLAAR